MGFPIRLAPKWLLNAPEVIVAVHVDEKTWRHRFAVVDSQSDITHIGTQFEEPPHHANWGNDGRRPA